MRGTMHTMKRSKLFLEQHRTLPEVAFQSRVSIPVGQLIVGLLKLRGITATVAARRAGVTLSAFSRVLHRDLRSQKVERYVGRVLGIDPFLLWGPKRKSGRKPSGQRKDV